MQALEHPKTDSDRTCLCNNGSRLPKEDGLRLRPTFVRVDSPAFWWSNALLPGWLDAINNNNNFFSQSAPAIFLFIMPLPWASYNDVDPREGSSRCSWIEVDAGQKDFGYTFPCDGPTWRNV
jgi:hypothetical protein